MSLMPPEAELIQKRRMVGIIAIVSASIGLGAWLTEGSASAIAGPAIRIGIVLAALWLALPTRTRPAAWARIRPWHLVSLILFLIFLPRLKAIIPVLIIGIVIGWLLRRRKR